MNDLSNISNLNFGAIPLKRVRVSKYDNKSKKFLPQEANFVILDKKNQNDITAINALPKLWEKAKFIKPICTDTNWSISKEYINIYAVTLQKNNFDKLNPNLILGMADMREQQLDGNELSYLQVKPTARNLNSPYKMYKGVGSSVIKGLKKTYDQIYLTSIEDENTEMFYKNRGFIPVLKQVGDFVWYKNNLKKLKQHLDNLYLKLKFASAKFFIYN